ncbi:MAG: FkbM family methyltransferase [Hyphomicrobiales bacterium]
MLDKALNNPFGTFAPTAFQKRIIDLTRHQPDNWLGRRIAFALRRLVLANLDHPLDVEALGQKMRLYPFNNVCEKRILFTPQYFDAAERDVLAQHMHDGFVFIDVGANIGGYALFVAGIAGPSARILAVEPQPLVFDRLTFNIRANTAGTVKAVACAVMDREGEFTLFLDDDNRGGASIKTISSNDHGTSALKVPAKTLLGLIREENLPQVDALKLDVEWAEDLILVPFFRDAPRDLWPRLIVMEQTSGRWQTDCIALARSRGYREIAATRMNVILELA